MVAIYDDAPVGEGVAIAAWRVRGADGDDPWTFYVDAQGGAVARDHSSIMRFADEIQGTVTGYGTPGTQPDTFDATSGNCPNDPDEFALADVLVSAYLEGTSTLVDSGFTGNAGQYSLDVTPSTDVDIVAELIGPHWFVVDASTIGCGEPAPLPYPGNPVTSPASGIDFVFNQSTTERGTALVNAHRAMSTISHWLDLQNAVPDVAVVVQDPAACAAGFSAPGGVICSVWEDGSILFGKASSSCPNTAYSTIIAHEYGHYIAWHLEVVQGLSAFNEGLADSVAALVFDTEFLGEDFFGCNDHFRWPRQPSIAAQQVYPKCEPGSMDPPVCSMGRDFGIHCVGELLTALWRDLHDEFEATDTRDLFLDWLMIAQPPAPWFCSVGGWTGQAAGPNTLDEVLQVAGNQQSVVEAICQVFKDRNIEHTDPTPNPCEPDSAGWSCYADCDGSAVLDFWDFLCFQNTFVAGDTYADCDADGELTFFDFLCFQNEFARGCP